MPHAQTPIPNPFLSPNCYKSLNLSIYTPVKISNRTFNYFYQSHN
ncbi:MAG: hypothetical protein AAF630_20315 [Cyanobacteria bacterium P01_C01_bin.38]